MAAAIKFPNRACPKCGKAIHIRAKEHDCGWKAEASAASPKTNPAKATSANGQPKSKMDAVRLLVGENGSEIKPVEITEQLKSRFKMKMDPATASNYKGIVLRERGGKKKIGRPKGHKMGRPAVAHSTVESSGAAITIADIQAVKELAERLGGEKLRQLAEVLA